MTFVLVASSKTNSHRFIVLPLICFCAAMVMRFWHNSPFLSKASRKRVGNDVVHLLRQVVYHNISNIKKHRISIAKNQKL